MAICKYFAQNKCRYGDRCRNDHIAGQQGDRYSSGGAGSGSANNNRFGFFSNGDSYRPNQNNSSSGAFMGNHAPNSQSKLKVSEADIKADLSERPLYPLSCYGPGKGAPRQLIEGLVEISPDELRLRYYTLLAAGNETIAKQEETELGTKMEQQVQAILNDVPGAIKYMEDGFNIHPNRIDFANAAASIDQSAAANPFQKPPAATNPFSNTPAAQPSTFGQAIKSTFGQPAFGKPSISAQKTPAFGQPSNSGQSVSPFGAAPTSGSSPPPFGQPSVLGSSGAFGKPTFGTTGFGKPLMAGLGSAFGQSNNSSQASAFGQLPTPGVTSGFGQPNVLGQKPNPFAKPGFGQSGFGQLAQPGATTVPFGQSASSPQSPFGQRIAPLQQPFGQPSQSGTPASPLGQPAQSTQITSSFQPGQAEALGNKSNPFASATSQSSFSSQPNKTSLFNPQPSQINTERPANSFPNPQLSTATGVPSNFGFPNQAAAHTAQSQSQPQKSVPTLTPQANFSGNANIDPKERFKEGKSQEYEGEQGKILEEIYRRVARMGRFEENEDIPLTPPKCEWIVPMPA